MRFYLFPSIVFRPVAALLTVLTSVATATVGHSAEPPPSTRLTHVGVERFLRDASGAGRLEKGWLSASGVFTLERSAPTVLIPNFPEEALGKRLMFTEAWFALSEQGPTARANFELVNPGRAYAIGTLLYYEVQPSAQARTDSGLLGNISSRASLSPAATLIAGFIIHERPRKVVIRGVGPSLREFDVLNPVEDPQLIVYSGSTVLVQNDNWSAGSPANTAALTAAFSLVGAFPLPEGSKDAALLIELPPGAYTAHVRSTTLSAGDALLEVYVLP